MLIQYDYTTAPTIKQFALSTAFIRGLMGPFGSGKSSACVIEILLKSMQQAPGADGIRRSRWVVIRNTYPQLHDTTIKTFLDWLPESHFGQFNKAEHIYRITGIKGVETEVLFRALDNPKHVANLLSLELTGAWVNEAREVPWEVIKPLMGRVGRYPAAKDGGPSWYGMILDTNPPDTESWWFNLFETNAYSDLAKETEAITGRPFAGVFKQPSGLSPDAENLRHLVKGYYQTLAADPDQDWVKVHVHGEYGYIRTGKPVYEQYKDNLHCRPADPIPGLPIYRGWDYGLTPACVFSQLGTNGQFRIIDELCAERAGIAAFSDVVIPYCKQNYPGYQFIDIGDPAGAQSAQTDEKSCFQIQRGKGIDIQPGHQSTEMRLESVRYALNRLIDGEPGLIVDPKAKNVRKGFQGGYQYRRMLVSGTRYAEKPDKNEFSHPHDALQYTAAELFGELVVGMNDKRPIQRMAKDEFNVFTGAYRDESKHQLDFDPFGRG